MHRTLISIASFIAFTALSVACVDAVTPTTAVPAAATTRKDLCRLVKSEKLTMDEQSPLGFSAREVFERMRGEAEVAISWLPPEDVSYGPEAGTTSLMVQLDAPRSAVFRHYEPETGTAYFCRDVVEMMVNMRVTTSGGALDEQISARFVASDVNLLTAKHTIRPTELGGELSAEDDGERELTAIQFTMRITPSSQAGELVAVFNSKPDRTGNGSTRDVVLARWGTTPREKPYSP